MMFGQDRDQLRRFFIEAWRKQCEGLPLQPLEAEIAAVVTEHPEYHPLLADPEHALALDADPEAGQSNPFLHMGMHLAIREQLSTDRPPGILSVFQALRQRSGDPHDAEHRLMECLGECLWEAARTGQPPDDHAYLECARRLTSSV